MRKVSLRGPKGSTKIDGESYALGEQIQYTDIWANDNYLQFMFERLMLLKELLAEGGSLYLHCDNHRVHLLRCVAEEVFSEEDFQAQIVWKRTNSHNSADRFGPVHDSILHYTKGAKAVWNNPLMDIDPAHIEQHYSKVDAQGRKYGLQELTAPGFRKGETGKPWRGFDPNSLGRHWRWEVSELEAMFQKRRIYLPESGGWPRLIAYKDDANTKKPASDWWDDVMPLFMSSGEREDYPTQKPEELLVRIIEASTNAGDLVLDSFIGSGTTAAVAQKLGRHWIGCDINKGAIQTTTKRLQGVITEQLVAVKQARQQQELIADDTPKPPPPAQLSFTVHRVNDYDLAIQHNEAVNLACEHIGITRTRGDSFFDGTIGPRLAKIIPFGHPLSLADLQELKRELESRRDEERDVVVICLGKELSVDGWLADWNRLRQRGDVPNKIEVIELRTDAKYGKFIAHQHAQAKVKIARDGEQLTVEVTDFISPSIIERLQQQAGLLKPKIDEWRAMVDCVMIDPSYNGQVFDIALADLPERKTDFVQGRYELSAPKGKTTVAVKITDMLGEEVLFTKTV